VATWLVDYCDVADVKPVLHLDLGASSEDVELAGCVSSGSGLVDCFLQVKGLTVPSVVPRLLKDAAANFAAWAYRRVRDPSGAQGFWNDAMQFLQTYVDGEFERTWGVYS
jgi:hypothetical protein